MHIVESNKKNTEFFCNHCEKIWFTDTDPIDLRKIDNTQLEKFFVTLFIENSITINYPVNETIICKNCGKTTKIHNISIILQVERHYETKAE